MNALEKYASKAKLIARLEKAVFGAKPEAAAKKKKGN